MMRPLAGLKIGISISESEGMYNNGIRNEDIAPFTLALAKRIISLGAAVVFGHQWRPNGIMDSVIRFAQVYRSESSPSEPIIYSLLASPDVARVSERDRVALKAVLEIRETITAALDSSSNDYHNQRRRNLCEMRTEMAKLCDARVCLGGKLTQFNHRSHGVIEEAALALKYDKSVYLCSLLSGSTSLLIDILRGQLSVFEVAQMLSGGLSSNFSHSAATPCNVETLAYLNDFASFGKQRFAEQNGLSNKDAEFLFQAQTIDAIISAITKGLYRIHCDNS